MVAIIEMVAMPFYQLHRYQINRLTKFRTNNKLVGGTSNSSILLVYACSVRFGRSISLLSWLLRFCQHRTYVLCLWLIMLI